MLSLSRHQVEQSVGCQKHSTSEGALLFLGPRGADLNRPFELEPNICDRSGFEVQGIEFETAQNRPSDRGQGKRIAQDYPGDVRLFTFFQSRVEKHEMLSKITRDLYVRVHCWAGE